MSEQNSRDQQLIAELRKKLSESEAALASASTLAETERAKLLRVFEQTPVALAILEGPKHRFTFANPAFLKQFQLSPSIVGREVAQIFPGESADSFIKIMDQVFQNEKRVILRESPLEQTLLDGGKFFHYLDVVYEPLHGTSGKTEGVIASATDVTQLVKAKQDAEAANAAKSSFLANMSHEIRTPLGAILGFAEILRDSALPSAERLQYLDTIQRNGHSLTRVIDDILDLTKVEAGRMTFEQVPVEFDSLIRDVQDLFIDQTNSKGLSLTFEKAKDFPHTFFTDPTRIRQILINILGNAVKFTNQGSIEVRCHAYDLGDKRLQIKIDVCDTGVGMNQEQLNKLFEPFIQADTSTTRKYGGSGLGLALSRRLAHALGGDVLIESSEIGKGSTVSLKIMARSAVEGQAETKISSAELAAPKPAQLSSSSANTLDGCRVLLAEDSVDNQFLISRILTKSGAVVTIANNGREAIEIINGKFREAGGSSQFHTDHDRTRVENKQSLFDIVLMDIQMPVMDGYATLEVLTKSANEINLIPVIALTAHAMDDERRKTKAAGFVAHLTKPIQREELLAAINEHRLRD